MDRTVGVRSNAPADSPIHCTLIDLDEKKTAGLRPHIRSILDAHDWRVAWIIESQKGYHIVFPHWTAWKTSLKIHRSFEPWGADDMHRRSSITRGAWVLRISRRTDDDLRHVATVRNPNGSEPVAQSMAAVYARLGVPMPDDLDESRKVVIESW